MRVLLALACLSVLAGCGGRLLVFDADNKAVVGVPIRVAETYVKQGFHNKLAKGGACDTVPFVETASIPTGERYYVAAEPGFMLKTGFRVKFNDAGAASEIGLDTEPAAADTLKALGEFYKAITPAAAATAAAAPAAAPGNPACDAGEKDVTFTRFDEYMKTHRPQ